MPHLLGIDVGTSGTKALLCTDAGHVVATATVAHTLQSPKPGWSEQDPEQWWAAACAATKAVLKKAKLKPADVGGVGLSGQMHGSVFVGKTEKPLRPAILWNDQRTQPQCDEITAAAGGRDALIKLVANPALTGFTAPKILWVRRHQPKVFERTRKVLLPKDYVRFRMTGGTDTEVSDASGTLLLDVVNRKWSADLLGKLDLDADLMPALHESPDITGTITKAAADAMGLAEGTPVVGGAGDVAAGAVGNGIVSAGLLNAALGTSGVVFAHSDAPTLDLGNAAGAPSGRVQTMCHAVPGKWCVYGCMLSAAGSFQWFREQLGELETAAARKRKLDVYDLLTAEAAAAPPGCEGLFFLPYLTGERCPHPDPAARGAWVGLTRRTTRAMMVRSLLEGVTFGMADMLHILRDGLNLPVTQIRTTGGGARSAFWRQLQADVYGAPVAITNGVEGAAHGVALLAGVGTGAFAGVEQACAAGIRTTEVLKPNRKSAALYARRHAVYAKLYGDLRGRFAEIASL